MKKLILPLAASVLLATAAQAAILADFNTDGVSQTTSGAPATLSAANLATGIDSSIMSRGLTKAGLVNTFAGSGWNSADLATAITGNKYLSVTITPTAGFEMTLESISFNWSQVNTGNDPDITLAVFASPLGFTAGDVIATIPYNQGDNGYSAGTTSLVGTAFQNITTATEFRVYGFGNAGAFAQGGFGISGIPAGSGSANDFVINGTVVSSAVPEPSTFAALAGLGALGFAATRRRRS